MSETIDMYNHYIWATTRLTSILSSLSEDQFKKKVHNDNRSIQEIVLHLISIYAYFSSQQEYNAIVEKSKTLNIKDLLKELETLTNKVINIFKNDPDKTIPVKTKNGTIKNVTGFSLFHMVSDHFAYHRGQIVTIFKELTGNEGIGTDYALFLME